VAADLPPAERPRIEALNPQGREFRSRVAALEARKGAAFSVCDLAMLGREIR
jgi:peptidylprolyl isomerase